MSTTNTPKLASGRPIDAVSIILTFATLVLAYYVGNVFYDALFGPLAKFPGPLVAKFTKTFAIRSMVSGNCGVDIPELHKKYGPVVRIAPHELSLSGGLDSFQQVYGFRHGQNKLPKDKMFYGKPINGVHSLISADDANHSRQRKILSNAFSDKALKEQEPLLKRWAGLMKQKLLERAEAGVQTDMLKYYNCTTFDVMGDLCFAEGLNMLEDSEYSPWVKVSVPSWYHTAWPYADPLDHLCRGQDRHVLPRHQNVFYVH